MQQWLGGRHTVRRCPLACGWEWTSAQGAAHDKPGLVGCWDRAAEWVGAQGSDGGSATCRRSASLAPRARPPPHAAQRAHPSKPSAVHQLHSTTQPCMEACRASCSTPPSICRPPPPALRIPVACGRACWRHALLSHNCTQCTQAESTDKNGVLYSGLMHTSVQQHILKAWKQRWLSS